MLFHTLNHNHLLIFFVYFNLSVLISFLGNSLILTLCPKITSLMIFSDNSLITILQKNMTNMYNLLFFHKVRSLCCLCGIFFVFTSQKVVKEANSTSSPSHSESPSISVSSIVSTAIDDIPEKLCWLNRVEFLILSMFKFPQKDWVFFHTEAKLLRGVHSD